MKNRIKELRLKNNMSQKQLAEKAGVSQQVLSFYETGDRTPKLETWIKLSTVFGVPVPYLQGISDFDGASFSYALAPFIEIDSVSDKVNFKFPNASDLEQKIHELKKNLDASQEIIFGSFTTVWKEISKTGYKVSDDFKEAVNWYFLELLQYAQDNNDPDAKD